MSLRPVRLMLFAALLLLSQRLPAAAQAGAIEGTVRTADTGQPVAGALVQAIGAGGVAGRATANAGGAFRVDGLAPGRYTVQVLSTGFATFSAPVTVGAGTASLAVTLTPQAVELDPIVISASRSTERALDAPARVEVVTMQEIQDRPAVAPVDHLRNVAGIDIASSGIQSANIVARGFNNVFSGSLYALSDHRIAGVPSLRVNLLQFIPSTNEDIERMEVVLGPGSALYGPNTANGVLHILTRSPLSEQGTTVALTGGERSLMHGSFRTAHLLGQNFGFKLSGQYLSADEWRYNDPVEQAERVKYGNPAQRADLIRAVGISGAEADARIGRIAARDFDVRRWSGEARADWRVTPELTTVFSAGATNSNGIELTGLGAGQAVDWRYSYYQARANYRRFFAQAYLNASDAGETFLLRNGAPIQDQSKLFVSQLQHGFEMLDGRQNFTYGLDFLRTLPETNGTINGIYEDDDDVTEIGGYLQSETALSDKFDLVLAGRLDNNSTLPDPVFSPRAAVVFKPAEGQAFRVTFNRAFTTPGSLTQFLDLGTPIPSAAAAQLGYSLRVQGTGNGGFAFRGPTGGYQIRSPFTPTGLGGPQQLLPAEQARLFWPVAVQAAARGAAAQGLVLPPQLIAFVSSLNPSPVGLTYFSATGSDRGALSALDLPDVKPVRESTSNTFELGYKGLLGRRLLLAADVWYSKRENLVTPLTITTPFVGFDAASTRALLTPALTGFFTQAYLAAGLPLAVAQQRAAADAATNAPLFAGGIAQVPVGVISSQDVNANGAQLLITYYNVDDDLDLYGTDLSATALLNNEFSLEASTSLVNEDVFTTRRGDRVTLNAPKSKATVGLNYRGRNNGFHGETRLRYNAAYPVDSGVFRGTACLGDTGDGVESCVDSFTLLDLTAGYQLGRRLPGASIQLSVQNLLDDRYRAFPGTPEIGRLALLRLRYEF